MGVLMHLAGQAPRCILPIIRAWYLEASQHLCKGVTFIQGICRPKPHAHAIRGSGI